MVLSRLYGVMSLDTLYPRQGYWQGAEPSPTTHTCTASQPQAKTPQPTTLNNTNGWVHDVTEDGDVDPNPGPTSPEPSAKRTRCNQDTLPTYHTPRMLHKRATDNRMPTKHKRRRKGDVEITYQEHQTQARECTLRKRKAEDTLDHQPPTKRQTSATHRGEQHAPEIQGNIHQKRPYEDTMQNAATEPPNKKIRKTQRLCTRPYPRPTRWLHDPTQDGDTEPNPGPTPPTRVDQATQTTLPGDSGIETRDIPPPPPPQAAPPPPPQQPDNHTTSKTGKTDTREQPREDCPICMDHPADTSLSCDPRHRLCRACATDPRLLRCPLCRRMLEPSILPPPLDDPTYEYFYIKI